MQKKTEIDPSARVDSTAEIGEGSWIGAYAQVQKHAVIGDECRLHKNVFVGSKVKIGSRVKIQNDVSLFDGVTLEDGVFIGPHVCFTNDKIPRAINPNGSLKTAQDWEVTPTVVQYGASIGANATIVCGVTIGKWAMVGSGAVVTRDVPDHGLALGNPAKLMGFVCKCGRRTEVKQGAIPACDQCA